MGVFSRLFGSRDGAFFRVVPDYVDRGKPPGVSTIPPATFQSWLKAAPFLLWTSLNGVWALIALVLYVLCPYDLSPNSTAATAPLSWAFFFERFPLWAAIIFGYTSFWHVTVCWLGWAERPFVKGRAYKVDKVAHNILWSFVGVVIWVGFENVFAFLWSTGRLPYESDAAAFSTPGGIARFAAALVLTPAFRDVHFFFAHRLLHFKAIYQQVHALHHRNTDIEPFAGMCMHPIEHLYYFACVLPSLIFFLSPFALLWNGMHLCLSPAAGHSGTEDHVNANSFHYMHHRYFEVNYAGPSASFLDKLFGSFCDRFRDADKDGAQEREDAKSTIWGLPSVAFCTYLLLAGGCVGLWAYAADTASLGDDTQYSRQVSIALSLLAGFGPVLVAYAMPRGVGGSDKQSVWNTSVQFIVGNLMCTVPVAYACYLALTPARFAI